LGQICSVWAVFLPDVTDFGPCRGSKGHLTDQVTKMLSYFIHLTEQVTKMTFYLIRLTDLVTQMIFYLIRSTEQV
jgi:hypothetical protein